MNRMTVTLLNFSCLLLLTPLLTGCGETKMELTDVEEQTPAAPAPAPAPAPAFDGRGEFNKLVHFMENSVAARISWFSSNESHRRMMKSAEFDHERFKNEGDFLDGYTFDIAGVENYDWNPSTNEGVLYWKVSSRNSANLVYRVSFYESGDKLKVGKIEECYDKTKSGDVKKLSYSTDITHYRPSKNLLLFWDTVLENYNK